MKKIPIIDYSSYSVNFAKNKIKKKLKSHLSEISNLSSINDICCKQKNKKTIFPINKINNKRINLQKCSDSNRQKCINKDYYINNYSHTLQKNNNFSKKIIQRNFNNKNEPYKEKNRNTLNESHYSKFLESIHFDEDISILETQTQNNNSFEKIVKEFEIRNLKKKRENLINSNNGLKKKIINLKEINFNLAKNTILKHYQNKLIVSDLINKYNSKGLTIQKNKSKKLTFKNLIFSLKNLKLDYEKKKLINSFYISLKEMILLSQIFTNEEIQNSSNDYIYLLNKLISLSNEKPNNYKNNSKDKNYYNIISKAVNILNNDHNKLIKIHFNKPINKNNNYNKNQFRSNPIKYNQIKNKNFRDLSENIQKYKNHNINGENNKHKNSVFKNNFLYLNNSSDNYTCNLRKSSSPFNIGKIKTLWDLKMKKKLKLNNKFQRYGLHYSSAVTSPFFKNDIKMNKKEKYDFFNENNIVNLTDTFSLNSVGNLVDEQYKHYNKIVKSPKLKINNKNLTKSNNCSINLGNTK